MATKFKEVNDKLLKTPLTVEELKMVDEVEKFVDLEIKKQFKGGEVHIFLGTANFKYDIARKNVSELPYARQELMRKELDKRYKEAGWKISVHIDDGLDGPNMSGSDYWILSGK